MNLRVAFAIVLAVAATPIFAVNQAPHIVLRKASSAAPPPQSVSLCTETERSLYACTMGKKLLSICASNDLSKSAGYLQYRFGRIDHLELQYPIEKLHPRGLFSLSFAGGGAKASFARLQFFNFGHKYTVIVYSSAGDDWAYGVEIKGPTGGARYLSCAEIPVANSNFPYLQRAGLTDIDEPPESHVLR